jgi:hypothetical protein
MLTPGRLAPVIACLAFGFANMAQALDVASARIARIGIDPRFEGAMVQLIDQADQPAWSGTRQFYLSSDMGDGGLATILTAFSLGENVWVRIAGDAAAGSLITIVFVNAPAP